MKTHDVSRRWFLAFCGGGIAGIWSAGTEFLRLPAEMAFAMSGTCSFCGRGACEVFGLAGIAHRNCRICNHCIELCVDILAEETGPAGRVPPRAEYDPEVAKAQAEIFDRIISKDPKMLAELRRGAATEGGALMIDAWARAIGRSDEVAVALGPIQRVERPVCSFCNKSQRDPATLIAGPTAYICDACIRDARALFMRYGVQPLRFERA